jgi:hypothetical protein
MFRIRFSICLLGMPDCKSFAYLSVAELLNTFSTNTAGKFCTDNFYHRIFSSVQNRTKNFRNMAGWEKRRRNNPVKFESYYSEVMQG